MSEETVATESEVVQPTETAAVTETAPQETEERKKGGFQRRIDKLTAERYRLEGELKAYRERDTAKEVKAEPQTAEDPEPNQDTFNTYEEWDKAHTRWLAKQVAREEYAKLSAKEEEKYQAAENQERERQVVTTYQKRTQTFMAEHDDFDEVVGTIQMNKGVGEAVQLAIMEDDNGPLIAYHLGQHPELCEKLNTLSPAAAVARIGRLAERLAPESVESTEPPKPKPEAEAPAKPITPVRKVAPTTSGPSEDDSSDVWLAKRLAQLKAAGRPIRS